MRCYGGYRLNYVGDVDLQASIVIKAPIGFVRTIPDGITDWSVMRSERTGENLLLVGPNRFVNSDCNPNWEYDFSSSSGIVQLRTKRSITKNSELLVPKFGPKFFERNYCKCHTCEQSLIQRIKPEFVDFIDLFINKVAQLAFHEKYELKDTLTAVKPKKKRLQQKDRVEMYNILTEAPVSQFSTRFFSK